MTGRDTKLHSSPSRPDSATNDATGRLSLPWGRSWGVMARRLAFHSAAAMSARASEGGIEVARDSRTYASVAIASTSSNVFQKTSGELFPGIVRRVSLPKLSRPAKLYLSTVCGMSVMSPESSALILTTERSFKNLFSSPGPKSCLFFGEPDFCIFLEVAPNPIPSDRSKLVQRHLR